MSNKDTNGPSEIQDPGSRTPSPRILNSVLLSSTYQWTSFSGNRESANKQKNRRTDKRTDGKDRRTGDLLVSNYKQQAMFVSKESKCS